MASQITSVSTVYSTVCSDQRKHQNSTSLAFVCVCGGGGGGGGGGDSPVTDEFPSQMPVSRKVFPLDDVIMMILIPQSHRPNRHETDLKPTKTIQFGERSVYSPYWFGFVGLMSVSVRAETFVGEISFKHVWKISPLGLRSVMYRAYVGRPHTDSRPILDRSKSDITPNCVESADTFPNQNRRVRYMYISQTKTECNYRLWRLIYI